MYAHLFTLTLAFTTLNAGQAATMLACTSAGSALEVLGGDPRIQLCGKLTGDVAKAEWTTATEVKLIGCVTSARITSVTVCIKNCVGKQEALTSTNGTLTPAMKKMIANLPAGTLFTVRVSVVDDSGKKWEVPDADFVWKG